MARALLPLLIALSTWAVVEARIHVSLSELLKLDQYDGAIRPQLQRGTTRVNVSMALYSLLVDEARQVLSVSGQLTQEWSDDSLSFYGTNERLINSVTLSGTSGEDIKRQVWRPDLTVSRQVKVATPDADVLRIDSDGHIAWIQRVQYDFPCGLSLSSYPLGVHKCVLALSSLGYTGDELEPVWRDDQALDHAAMVVSHGYTLSSLQANSKNELFAGKSRRQLRLEMTVGPRSGWAIKHTVIPMAATVTTAYLVFYINAKNVCARMITSMLSLVTAAIFHESTYRKVPPAHETMAIEVFTGTCLSFIFLAGLESVVVEVLSFVPPRSRRSPSSPRNSFALEVRDLKPDLMDDHGHSRGQVAAIWLDRCFRVLYPVGFFAFNAVYWVIYS